MLKFAVLLAASLLLWMGSLRQATMLAMTEEKYTHAVLALAAAMALFWMNWKNEDQTQSRAWAVVLLIGAAVFQFYYGRLASLDAHLTLSMASFVVWVIGSFLLCFGIEASRRSMFPLLFLFWIVPIPNSLATPLMSFLQRGSAISALCLFWISRTPVTLNNLVLTTPTLELEIAPECSSIRSSLILVVTTMVLAQILLQTTWRKLAIIAFSIPLSVVKNGFRIFTIGWLTEHVDSRIIDSSLHHRGGVIFLSLALLIVIIPLWFLRRAEQRVLFSGALPLGSEVRLDRA